MSGAEENRRYWLSTLRRLADPVLGAAAGGRLRATMPVEVSAAADAADRRRYSHLEALARVLSGIAPWIENGPRSGEEGAQRDRIVQLARAAISHAVDPKSPDFLNWNSGNQPLVDAAFFAQAMIRAPIELFQSLDAPTRGRLIECLRSTRSISAGPSNWILFPAMIETALKQFGSSDCDRSRIDYALRQFNEWHKGDGIYGDGPELHVDYYNSFVIHPMLLEISREHAPQLYDIFLRRSRRLAEIQERIIAPDGSFPPIGRSLAYRGGAFQTLAQMALLHQLPPTVSPAAARCALTAVLKRTIEAPGTFDANGWLTIGLCGHQPGLGERYISTGSCYLCTACLLPLGLPPDDPFWAAPDEPWSGAKIWSGADVPADKALY